MRSVRRVAATALLLISVAAARAISTVSRFVAAHLRDGRLGTWIDRARPMVRRWESGWSNSVRRSILWSIRIATTTSRPDPVLYCTFTA